MGPTAQSVLEVHSSHRKMPLRTRAGVLIALGGALAGVVAALSWIMPPVNLLSAIIWGAAVAVAVMLVGVYTMGFAASITLRIEPDRIRTRQLRFEKELLFSQIRRIYLFRDREQERLALLPREGPAWYVGLGLSRAEFDAVRSKLWAVADERGIDFRTGVTFADMVQRESAECPVRNDRTS